MPVSCPGGGKARYRWKGGKVRLAFCGNQVVEAKSKSGRMHTQAEFKRDRRGGGRR